MCVFLLCLCFTFCLWIPPSVNFLKLLYSHNFVILLVRKTLDFPVFTEKREFFYVNAGKFHVKKGKYFLNTGKSPVFTRKKYESSIYRFPYSRIYGNTGIQKLYKIDAKYVIFAFALRVSFTSSSFLNYLTLIFLTLLSNK